MSEVLGQIERELIALVTVLSPDVFLTFALIGQTESESTDGIAVVSWTWFARVSRNKRVADVIRGAYFAIGSLVAGHTITDYSVRSKRTGSGEVVFSVGKRARARSAACLRVPISAWFTWPFFFDTVS